MRNEPDQSIANSIGQGSVMFSNRTRREFIAESGAKERHRQSRLEGRRPDFDEMQGRFAHDNVHGSPSRLRLISPD
jgi:hypothetical protein